MRSLYLHSGVIAMMMRPTGTSSGKWVKGGFQSKMDRKEAIQILGLRCVASMTNDAGRRVSTGTASRRHIAV